MREGWFKSSIVRQREGEMELENVLGYLQLSEQDLEELEAALEKILPDITEEEMEIKIDFDGSTYTIDNNIFFLSFSVTDNRLSILKIEVYPAYQNQGLARAIIEQLHSFAYENDLELWASKVEDSARSYWEKMGFVESERVGDFYNPEL